MTEKEKIINDIIMHLKNEASEESVSVYLFGSYGKDTYSEESDVDLLLISKDPLLNINELVKKIYKKTVSLSKDMDILGYTYDEIKAKLTWSSFFNTIIQTGEVIYGKRIA